MTQVYKNNFTTKFRFFNLIFFCTELLTVPPGFTSGLNFCSDNVTVSDNSNVKREKVNLQNNIINLMDVVKEERKLFGKIIFLNYLTSKYFIIF